MNELCPPPLEGIQSLAARAMVPPQKKPKTRENGEFQPSRPQEAVETGRNGDVQGTFPAGRPRSLDRHPHQQSAFTGGFNRRGRMRVWSETTESAALLPEEINSPAYTVRNQHNNRHTLAKVLVSCAESHRPMFRH